MKTMFKSTVLLASTFVMIGLTGCQSMKPQLNPAVAQAPEAMDEFNLQGKIGVKTPKQSGSAFFTWQQHQQQFDIELSGILGVGKTQISGQPGLVTLTSAKTGTITAASPEELLFQATGWVTPITHLVQWIQAKPATSTAVLEKDDLNRITQIEEDGWNIQLSYNQQNLLPNRLILKQQLEAGAENRITIVIQNR